MRKEKGFTLVELLVVIAIIAVLAGAVLMAINPATMMKKARDSKRLQDLDTLVKSVNLALTDGEIALGAMAAVTDSATGTQAVDGTGWVQFTVPAGKTGLAKFVAALPIDPTNDADTGFIYQFRSTLTDFEINAQLEYIEYNNATPPAPVGGNYLKMTTDGGNNANKYEAGTSLVIMN